MRIVIAGAGAVGASIAYHLALPRGGRRRARQRETIASGATGKAMGGFRQQFSPRGGGSARAGERAAVSRAGRAAVRAGRLPLPRHDRRRVGTACAHAPRCSAAGRARRGGRRGARAWTADGRRDRRRARAGRTVSRARRGHRASWCAARPSAVSRCGSAPMHARSRTTSSSSRAARRRRSSSPSSRSVRFAGSSSTSARSPTAARPADDDRGRDDVPFPPARRHPAPGDDGAAAAVDERAGRRRVARRRLSRTARAPLSVRCGCAGRARLGGPVRHDPGRTPGDRLGGGRGVRRVRLFRSRLHAGAGGWSCGCGRPARPRAAAGPGAVSVGALCHRGAFPEQIVL